MSATANRLAVAIVLAALLTGCSAEAPKSTYTPHPDYTSPPFTTQTPEPTPTAVDAISPPAVPVMVFEALGDGEANVTWANDGTVVQREVSLPFAVDLVADGYTAGVVQRMAGAVGCRLTLDGVVIDEKPVQEGQLYAECVSKG